MTVMLSGTPPINNGNLLLKTNKGLDSRCDEKDTHHTAKTQRRAWQELLLP
jgi:hypothetical protein